MRKNIKIEEFENKETKEGKKYTRFKTSDGWISCFDVKECEKLKELKGKFAEVELLEQGNFKNIKKCYGEGVEGKEEIQAELEPAKNSDEKYKAMYVSYAKDIFCCLVGVEERANASAIKDAVEIVKFFRENL